METFEINVQSFDLDTPYKLTISRSDSIEAVKKKIKTSRCLPMSENMYLAFDGKLLKDNAIINDYPIKQDSKIMFYVPTQKKLNLTFLSLLIRERTEHNQRLIEQLSGQSKKIFYPFGYTGAGKTTFILYSYDVELRQTEFGSIEATGEIPEALKDLVIGSAMKSQTVFITATVHDGWVFLDGPGQGDTGGPAIDIANVVSCTQLFEHIPQLCPIVFIEYTQLETLRGQLIRKLLTSLASMFSDNIDILEKHMIVVFTKIPKMMNSDIIRQKMKDVMSVDAEDNTPIVKELLDLICCGLQALTSNSARLPLAGRVIIFQPDDPSGVRKIRVCFNSTPQLENPKDVFKTNLEEGSRLALQESLHHLKNQIPTWLKEGHTEQLAEHLVLLKSLSGCIPEVKSTLSHASSELHQNMCEKLVNAKEFLELILQEGNVDTSNVSKFTDVRKLFTTIEPLREFMEPLEELSVLDKWTVAKFAKLEEIIKASDDFKNIGIILQKFRNLTSSFEYLPGFQETNDRCLKYVQERVEALKQRIEKVELLPTNINQIHQDLLGLIDATNQVQPFLSFDCKQLVHNAIKVINQNLDEMATQIIQFTRSKPMELDLTIVNQFQTIRLICAKKSLSKILNEVAEKSSLEDDDYTLSISNELEKAENSETAAAKRFLRIRDECVAQAKESIEQLKLITGRRDAALDSSNEKYLRNAKTLESLDKTIQEAIQADLNKTIYTLESHIDSLLVELKNIVFNTKGPDFKSVPGIIKELEACKWVDKYTFNPNRIQQKMDEAIKILSASLKNLTVKIQSSFIRNKYQEVEEQFTAFEAELSNLSSMLPQYEESKKNITEYLTGEFRKIYSYGEQRMSLNSSSSFTFPDGDQYISRLKATYSLAVAIGLKEEHEAAKKKVIRHFQTVSKDMVDEVLGAERPYKWKDFNRKLNQLQPIRSKTEYPNFDDEIRGSYDKVLSSCRVKIEELIKEAQSRVHENSLMEIGPLLMELQGAIILIGHIPDIQQSISLVIDTRMQAIKDASVRIQSYIQSNRYREAFSLLESSLKPAPNEKPSNSYNNAIQSIKHSFEDAYDNLIKTISFYTIFVADDNTDNSYAFRQLLVQVTNFLNFHQTFASILKNEQFSNYISNINTQIDSKFVQTINNLNQQLVDTELGMQKLQRRLRLVDELINLVESSCSGILDLTQSRNKAAEFSKKTEQSWNNVQTQFKSLEGNIDKIDEAYESYINDPNRSKTLQQLFRQGVSRMIDVENIEISRDTVLVRVAMTKLQQLGTQIFNPDLRNIVKDYLDRVNDRIQILEKNNYNELEMYLQQWDLAKVRSFLQEKQNDPELVAFAQQKLVEVSNSFVEPPTSLNSPEGLINYCDKLRRLQELSELDSTMPFLKILKPSVMENQFQNLRTRALNKLEELQRSFVGQSPPKHQLQFISSYVEELTIMGAFKEVITTQKLEDAVTPVVQLFSNNKKEYETAIGRYEFHKINDALNYFLLCDPLLTRLKALVQSHGPPSFEVLRVTIAGIFDSSRALKETEDWLAALPSKVESDWEKKDFSQIYKVMWAVSRNNPEILESSFPHVRVKMENVKNFINNKYNELSQMTIIQLEQKDWTGFRANFSILEGLRDIETLLGKKTALQLKNTIESNIKNLKERTNINDKKNVMDTLIDLNQMSLNIPQFKDKIQEICTDLLEKYGGSPENGDEKIYELGVTLNNVSGVNAKNAKDIVASFPEFAAISQKVRQEATAKQTIEWALGCWGDEFDLDNGNNTAPLEKQGVPRFLYTDLFSKEKSGIWSSCIEFCKKHLLLKQKSLLDNYNSFIKKFDELYEKAITHGISALIEDTKNLFSSLAGVGRKLVEILAHICAVWSRVKTSQFRGKNRYRLLPHPIQVLCLFRLLEGSPNEGYLSQLIEVLTGEGKSVILGVVATYFGLLGFDVYSICYSSYLSKRDYQDFVDIFEAFGIKEKIVYSTISEMCEITINQTGSVRDLTKSVVESATKPPARLKSPNKNRILLIDEVDVFFGSDFYGNTYNPATMISNEHTYEILNFIYSNRTTDIKFNAISKTPGYTSLISLFPQLKLLINHEINKMLKDVKNFENTPEKPIVMNNIIYYKDQDSITCNKVYGYKTSFQYFQKFTDGDIQDPQVVKDHVGMYLGCGNFSFAEIPGDFTYKMGVSGTLQSLTTQEKKIIQDYGIQRLAYAPSIYGGSRCNASSGGKSEITIYEPANWFLNITQAIKDKTQAGRAVLVFFENLDILNNFSNFLKGKNISFQVLTEKEEFKETIIKQSTASKMVTLCTRPFGRGVDFIVRDPTTKSNGGVHVIQTFVAMSEAEQIQIKGRAARQGDPGSHEFILSHPNLKQYLGSTEGQPANTGFDDFAHDNQLTRNEKEVKLVRLRDALYEIQVKELDKKRANALKAHNLTKQFYSNLLSFDNTPGMRDEIISLLMKLNEGSVTSAGAKYHLYFCLDESGSMAGSPWRDLLNAVEAFINKRIECCNANGCPVEDVVTVVNYASSARVVFSSQAISPSLVQNITFMSGGTDFAAGLYTIKTCIEQTTPQSSGYVPCLIFMSDGGCSNGDKEMVAIAKAWPNIKVFVIGFSSGCDRPRMTALAEQGKGQFFFGADGTQLKGEFERVSVKISGGEMVL